MSRYVKESVALVSVLVIAALVSKLLFIPSVQEPLAAGPHAAQTPGKPTATLQHVATPTPAATSTVATPATRPGTWITLGSYSTGPGTLEVSVQGGGFAPRESIDLSLQGSGGIAAASLQADSAGRVSGSARLHVTASAPATLHLVATGQQSNRRAMATIGVVPFVPVVSLSTYAAILGEAVDVSARGFAPNEAVQLAVDTRPIVLTRTGADGSLQVRSAYTVPYGARPGLLWLTASGLSSRRVAWQRLSIQPLRPWATASSYVVHAGDHIQFDAHGFADGEGLAVYDGSAYLGHSTGPTDRQGNIGGLGPFVVPSGNAHPTYTLIGARSGARVAVALTEVR